jgi:hypothetical protein
MNRPPPWERADRYRQLMEQKGYRSVRALARAIGEDHSRIARSLKVLDLPAGILATLRGHSDDVRVRTHFTEKRLRQLVGSRSRSEILSEIKRLSNPRLARETLQVR